MSSKVKTEEKEKKPKRKKRTTKKTEKKEKAEKKEAAPADLTPEEEAALAEIFAAAAAGAPVPPAKPKLRTIGLFGAIDEEMSAEIIASLLSLRLSGKEEERDPPDSEPVTTYKPIEMWISTWGGVAMDMFSIYDAMRLIREDCDIETVAMGKVMSAGVLLLAAGTKGKRKIGKNCRIMMHSVIGGHSGNIHNLENEMEEVRWIQNQHIRCMVDETDMSEKYLRKLLGRKVNVYLNAVEAVELGIADEIF
jgi:ATP-dependent Clp protease protease subunit